MRVVWVLTLLRSHELTKTVWDAATASTIPSINNLVSFKQLSTIPSSIAVFIISNDKLLKRVIDNLYLFRAVGVNNFGFIIYGVGDEICH